MWRVVVTIVLVQLLSGCAAVFLEPCGSLFIDFWFGGAVGSVFGFILGLIWQLKAVSASWHTHRQILLFMGSMSILFFIAAFVLPLEQFAAQVED